MTTTSPAWTVAGASWRGTSHRKSATPCQDAFAWECADGAWVALAVADGAGSAPLADLGSKLAVQSAVAFARAALTARPRLAGAAEDGDWRSLLSEAAGSARSAVVDTARRLGRAPRALASTLILVLAGPGRTAAIQIGDGASVLESSEGEVRILTTPDTGEYMGETSFLTGEDALERARIAVVGEVRSIALFSDGLQMQALTYPKWEPYLAFFRPTFDFLRDHRDAGAAAKIEAFLSSDRLAARTDDDVTLLLAGRVPQVKLPPVPLSPLGELVV